MSLSEISPAFTAEVLNEIVRAKNGPRAKHKAWRFSKSGSQGDSYMSEIFKLEIDAVEEATSEPFTVHTVIKAIPKNAARRKTFRSGEFYRNEIDFYQKVLRRCLELQAEVRPKIGFNATPTCLAAFHDGVNDFIALEDLSVDGYGTASRLVGLDVDHCRVALESLAKLHALSLVYRHQRPEEFAAIIDLMSEPYYTPRLKDWYKDFQLNQIEVARHAVRTEYPNSTIERKMEAFFSSDLYDRMIQLTHTRTRYSVLGHGDCWAPNFLFKYSEDGGAPIAAKMIDFQLARFASPALDISLFIYACTTQELRERHYEDLLKAYHRSARELIESFGSSVEQVFPYSALLDEMQQFGCFGLGGGIEAVPFSVMETGCDIEKDQGDEAVPLTTLWYLTPLEKKEDRRRLADIFKHAIDVGYL